MIETMVGLTPTIIVRMPQEIDLTEAAHVYVSFKQAGKLILKKTDGFTVAPHEVSVYLTQEETLKFAPRDATIQVNWTYATGQRGATRWVGIAFNNNHLPEVLP